MGTLDLQALGLHIKSIRESRGIKQQKIAQLLDVSKQLVSHWEHGRSELTLTNLVGLAAIFRIDVTRLLDVNAKPASGPLLNLPGLAVPLFTKVELLEHALTPINRAQHEKWVSANGSASPNAAAFHVFDRSMHPTFQTNDLVVFDPSVNPEPGACVLVALPAEEALLFRRYRPAPTADKVSAVFSLRADNPDYEPRSVTKRERAVLMGTLSEHIRFGPLG